MITLLLLPCCLADLTTPPSRAFSVSAVCARFGPRLDFEGLDNGEDGFLDKAKSWSRSIEDLHHANSQPFCNTLVRSARQSVLRYVQLRQLPRVADGVPLR